MSNLHRMISNYLSVRRTRVQARKRGKAAAPVCVFSQETQAAIHYD